MELPPLVKVQKLVQANAIQARIANTETRTVIRKVIDQYPDSALFLSFKERVETARGSTALATAERQMNLARYGYYSTAAAEIAATISEDWDGNHVPHLQSLISKSGHDLIIGKSGIGSFLIEVIAPLIIHHWIIGDLQCSPNHATEILEDSRSGDYGRLVLDPDIMEHAVGAKGQSSAPQKQKEEGRGSRGGGSGSSSGPRMRGRQRKNRQ